MLLAICAVRDTKTKLYDQPFPIRSTVDAVREFEILKQDPKTRFGKNPDDFELFQIATYDDETGQIKPMENYLPLI